MIITIVFCKLVIDEAKWIKGKIHTTMSSLKPNRNIIQ